MDWNKGIKGRWKRLFTVIFLLTLCTMVGCGGKSKEINAAGDVLLRGISVFACWSGRSFCDKGMVQIEDGLMIFHEYGTGKSYPLCSDAYCEHIPYSGSKNPDPVCEATMKDLKQACIYGDYVYTIQDGGWEKLIVKARNLNEKGYREVAKLPYCQPYTPFGFNAVIGDKAYLLLAKIDKEFSEEVIGRSYNSNDLYTYLVELDLKTGDYKTLLQVGDGKKYKVLSTTYREDGVYCRCYYEDYEANEDFTVVICNDYREVFYYVAYDGSEVKELCPEVAEMTVHGGDVSEGISPAVICDKGVFIYNKGCTELLHYRYDGTKETVYKLPEGYERFNVDGISGDSLLLSLVTPEKEYQRVVIKLDSKKVTPVENKSIKNAEGFLNFIEIGNGAFLATYGNEEKNCLEVWSLESLLSENGQPLFHHEELIIEKQLPFLSGE